MTQVLVDTSLWRRYLAGRTTRAETGALDGLLDEDDALLVHVAVIAELVLGGLAPREEELVSRLPNAPEIASAEVLAFVRDRKLSRRKVGWLDAQLLASALVAGARLWSHDRALARAAHELGVGFAPPKA